FHVTGVQTCALPILMNLFVSELGLIKDVNTFENMFSVSHENGGGPDGGEGSKKMIDGDITTKIFVGGVGPNMSWQFLFDSPQVVNGYSLTSGNDAPDRDPRRWKVEGSIDGKTWVVVEIGRASCRERVWSAW